MCARIPAASRPPTGPRGEDPGREAPPNAGALRTGGRLAHKRDDRARGTGEEHQHENCEETVLAPASPPHDLCPGEIVGRTRQERVLVVDPV
jgi:hypothetical protein